MNGYRGKHYTEYRDDDELTLPVFVQRIGKFNEEFYNEAGAAAEEIAGFLKVHADSRHEWQNRTGQTEESTRGWWSAERLEIAVHLSAGTYYAQFLEWARNGKWAWLGPTMLENQAKILQTWTRFLGG